MRTKFFAGLLLLTPFAAGGLAAVVVEKNSRQLPYVEVVDCQGVHSFVFRGPTGTSRKPILVPPREYWTEREAGLYKFVLRYHSGNVRSRLVTPEVFARYRVGDDFRDSSPGPGDQLDSDDSKVVQPVTHHHRRHRTAQLRKKTHSSHRMAAKRHRSHRTARLAAR